MVTLSRLDSLMMIEVRGEVKDFKQHEKEYSSSRTIKQKSQTNEKMV